ncbi:MAG: hypothetical protein RMK32_10270 [Anaerolineae bacterium]|nr:hypothetical protein [Anaerolineae bacterium]
MTIRILRITRHPLHPLQRVGLEIAARKLTGRNEEVEIVEHAGTISGPEEVLEMVKEYKADIVELVLPIGMLAAIVSNIRIPVIRAIMERSVDETGVTFRWRGYEHIRSISVETANLVSLDELQGDESDEIES